MSDKTIKWTLDADPAPLDAALEASGKKADDLGDKLKAAADEHRAATEKAASDIKKMFEEASAESQKASDSAKKLGGDFGDVKNNVKFLENAVGAASDFISGNLSGAWTKAKSAYMAFRNIVAVNPYVALVGFTIAAAAVIAKTFKEMSEKTDALIKKLEKLRGYRTEMGFNIDEVGNRTYDENQRRAAAKTESSGELKSMLAGTEDEIAAREKTARKNLDEYNRLKREAALLEAKGNWAKRLLKPKSLEDEEKAKRIDEEAERLRENLLDPSVAALGEARSRANDLRDRIESAKKREAEKREAERAASSGAGADKNPEPSVDNLLDERVELARARISDRFTSITDKLKADLEYAQQRMDSSSGDQSEEGQREQLKWAWEVLKIEREITEEKKRQEEVAKELASIRDEAALIGLDREEWLKKRIEQVRVDYKAETDPVKKASLGLTGKQLSNELKGLLAIAVPAAQAEADKRPLSPTGSGVHMNDMSKVSAGGVSMVKQPFGNKKRGPSWSLQSIGGSASLSELMDLGRGQSPLSVDPQAKIARNTEKTNELLDDIRQNLKGVS